MVMTFTLGGFVRYKLDQSNYYKDTLNGLRWAYFLGCTNSRFNGNSFDLDPLNSFEVIKRCSIESFKFQDWIVKERIR